MVRKGRVGWRRSGFRTRKKVILTIVVILVISALFFSAAARRAEGKTLVEIAASQVGAEDGKKYWKWYGFDEPCDWCACFVSWCIAGDGSLTEGERPRFSYCQDGTDWFIRRQQWRSRKATPQPGMIIFFDRNRNRIADHVGIVKSVENGQVETIEGDSGGRCEENFYDADRADIMGYGFL